MYRYAAALSIITLAGNLNAATVIGNLDNTTPGTPVAFTSTSTISVTQSKAAVFSVNQTLTLGSVFLALSNFDSDDTTDFYIGRSPARASPGLPT